MLILGRVLILASFEKRWWCKISSYTHCHKATLSSISSNNPAKCPGAWSKSLLSCVISNDLWFFVELTLRFALLLATLKGSEQRCASQVISIRRLTCYHHHYQILKFIEKRKNAYTPVYTNNNIPQEERTTIVCQIYETVHLNKPPIPALYLRDMLRLWS